jgi:hypothetical protein
MEQNNLGCILHVYSAGVSHVNDLELGVWETARAEKTTAIVAIALAISSAALGQAAHTHWEPYKNASRPPSVDQDLTDPVLVGAIDLHAHYGPDSYPRQWDAFEVAALAQARGLRAVVLALDVMFKDNPARLLGLPTR